VLATAAAVVSLLSGTSSPNLCVNTPGWVGLSIGQEMVGLPSEPDEVAASLEFSLST